MPVVDLYLRTPGNHHILGRVTMDTVPRAGELVTYEGETRYVHQVTHNTPINVTEVLLKE